MLPNPVVTISRQHMVFEQDMPKAEGAKASRFCARAIYEFSGR
jgi:hypothetical protein